MSEELSHSRAQSLRLVFNGDGHFGALSLTVGLSVISGACLVLALNSVPILWSIGVVFAVGYLFFAFSRNTIALVVFVLTVAEFLGLLPESVEVGPVKIIDIVTAILLIPFLISLLKADFPFKDDSSKHLRWASVILLILIGGEILLTSLNTDQSFWLSVKAAKPYLYYFTFLVVPVYATSVEQVRRLANWMTVIAAGLSLMYLLISLVGEIGSFPALVVGEANYVGLGTFTRVRSMGAPLIVAMLLYQFYRFADGKSSSLEKVSLILLAMGTTVHFYRSLWVGILVGIIVQACVEGKRGARSVAKFLSFIILLMIVIGVIHPEYGGMIASRAQSTVTEVEQLNGSYGVRREQIERWTPILRNHLLSGIGFLHHDSAVGQQLEAMYGLEGTGNYDVGWVDILGRLGLLGTLLLILGLFQISRDCWRPTSYQGGGEIVILKRVITAYLVAGVVSLPGYPLLSSAGGIIPLALIVGMLAVLEEHKMQPLLHEPKTELPAGIRQGRLREHLDRH
jgi:hypothetical protein